MSSLFSTILEISLAVGIIILLIVILSPWMDKKFTHKWKYYLWLVLAVRLLIPFSDNDTSADCRGGRYSSFRCADNSS